MEASAARSSEAAAAEEAAGTAAGAGGSPEASVNAVEAPRRAFCEVQRADAAEVEMGALDGGEEAKAAAAAAGAGGKSGLVLEAVGTSPQAIALKLPPDYFKYGAAALVPDQRVWEETLPRYKRFHPWASDHSAISQWLGHTGRWFVPLMLLVPLVYVLLVMGTLPVGNPDSTDSSEWLLYALVQVPILHGSLAFIQSATFFFLVGMDRPWQVHLGPSVMSAAVTAILTTAVWSSPEDRPPPMWGTWLVLATYVTVLATLGPLEIRNVPDEERRAFWRQYLSFFKVQLTFGTFYLLMCVYVILWRQADEVPLLELVLPAALGLFTWILRKAVLKSTATYELEPALLVSSFGVDNIADTFMTMAFTGVTEPGSLLFVWLFPNMAHLFNCFFISDMWFEIRLQLKAFAGFLYKCRWEVPPEEKLDRVDDRGWGENRPAYRRRKFRFFVFGTLSTAFAMVSYVASASLLRFGVNRDYYPFALLERQDFNSTIIYAAGNAVFIVVAMLIGIRYIKNHFRWVYHQVVGSAKSVALSHTYIGFLATLVVQNQLLAIAMMQKHNNIFWLPQFATGEE